ncbi:MAG TPA: GMC family oxidoreductase N-terminal domain-containing protein [Xanthobacteraceae bacterium]|nr:GMC family oxidoreductase N-terminal domain-containing protein [Xanthobacteraceae bacterium]
METFDYVVIGAGSAGCVLANRLSADENLTVCVLEAGPPDRNPFIHIPAGFIKTFYHPKVNWCYSQEPGPYTAGRRIFAPRGKTLGGSSAINGLIYNRGQRLDFDGWAQAGNRGWGYADVLPYFKRLERRVGACDPLFRGQAGPLAVTDIDWHHPLCDAFIEGAVSLGIPRNPDYNAATQQGVAYAQRTIHNGRRVSAATAFLHPVAHRRNLSVRTGAHATALVLEGRRAVGVRYRRGGREGPEIEVRARREVILSGGAYNSPQLLQLSGIGPAPLLKSLGIPIRHALPGVGEGLQDHYAPRTVARVKNAETINEAVRGLRLLGEVGKWVFLRKGILTLSPTLVYCFWHSGESAESSDLQITFTPASYKEGEIGKLEDEPGMTCAAWQQRPESRGYVRVRTSDPFDPPVIQTNYLTAELDRRVVVAGMRLARRLLRTEPLAPYYAYEDFPGPDVETDDEFLHAATQRGQTTFHASCTCRMGPATDPNAVVDDTLRVHGLDALRVVDASIMPRMISANLNAATLMIADKAADMILGRAPPEPVLLPEP